MVKNFSLIAYWFGTTKIHPMQLMIYFYFMQKGKKNHWVYMKKNQFMVSKFIFRNLEYTMMEGIPSSKFSMYL